MTTYSIGQTLAGGYRVIDVKAGGMGVVYICHQSGTDQFYAIKTVKFQSAHDSEELARRFRNEVFEWIKISNQRKHGNVVQALLYNQDERWLFLEYVDGLPMHQAMPKCASHLKHAFDWAMGIASGMDCLHREFSYIHRDLKPQNVMICAEDLVPKITDLGIGKVIQEGSSDHTLIGTPGYMAPETFQGQADFRSDIYAYGAVVYRMVAGEAPFGRGAPSFDRLPPAPSEKNPGVPEELDKLILRCLEPNPTRRFQSFEDILGGLDELPTIAETRTAQKYRFCQEHQFFSPMSPKLSECLFCDHSSRHVELMEAATEASAQLIEEVPTIPISEEAKTRSEAATASEPTAVTEDMAQATATARPDPTRTAPPQEEGAAERKSRVPLMVLIVVLMAVAVGSAVAINHVLNRDTENGGNPDNGNGVGRVPIDEPDDDEKSRSEVAQPVKRPNEVVCQVPGCDRKFKQDEAWYEDDDSGELLTKLQVVCRSEDHEVCLNCWARFPLGDPRRRCTVCREQRKITSIKVASANGQFPPPDPPKD